MSWKKCILCHYFSANIDESFHNSNKKKKKKEKNMIFFVY